MNADWIEQYARQHISELREGARADHVVRTAVADERSRSRVAQGAVDRRPALMRLAGFAAARRSTVVAAATAAWTLVIRRRIRDPR